MILSFLLCMRVHACVSSRQYKIILVLPYLLTLSKLHRRQSKCFWCSTNGLSYQVFSVTSKQKRMMYTTCIFLSTIVAIGSGSLTERLREYPNNPDDCYSRNIDLVFAAPATGTVQGETLQRQSFVKLLNLFMNNEELELTRLKVSLIKLEINSADISAKTVFHHTRYETRLELEQMFGNISMRNVTTFGEPYHWLESTEYSNKHVGKRYWSTTTAVMLLYDVTDEVIQMAVNDSRVFSNIKDLSAQSKLLIITDNNASYHIEDSIADVVQIRHASLPGDSTLSYMDEFLCRACEENSFSSFDGTKCYTLLPEIVNWFYKTISASLFCFNLNAASMPTERDYNDVKGKIESILLLEIALNGGYLPTHVALHLKGDVAGFAKHYKWRNGSPLLYDRWVKAETLNQSRLDCILWTFRQPEPLESLKIESGWWRVDCYEPTFFVRPLCEKETSPESGTTFRGKLQMTPLLPANRKKDETLALGNFGRLEMKYQGKDTFRYYLPASKMISYLLEGLHPRDYWILPDRAEGALTLHVKAVNLPNVTTIKDLEQMDFKPWFFQCGKMWLPYSYVCDAVKHCKDGSDEVRCGALDPTSPENVCDEDSEYPCKNNRCIPQAAVCDLYPDCLDSREESSDESGTQCSCNYFDCAQDECVPQAYGRSDCIKSDLIVPWKPSPHSNDRWLSYSYPPTRTVFVGPDSRKCAFFCNRTDCVKTTMLGDDKIDCHGPEGHIDETWGRLENYSYPLNERERVLWSPKCILVRDRFGEIMGFRSMVHLQGCENFECPEGYVKCPDNYCIPNFAVSDGTIDCPKGEDERGHGDHVEGDMFGMFRCDEYGYIHPELVCDGYKHCKDGSDEMECAVKCRSGFLCLGDAIAPFDYDFSKTLEDLSFIDERVRLLDLSNIAVPSFFKGYPSGNFRHLLYLMLSKTSITSLESPLRLNSTVTLASEKDFLTVVHLDLSRNLITTIDENSILQKMRFLVSLDLSYNIRLRKIAGLALQSVTRLEELDLSWCGLQHLPVNVFDSLPVLKKVSLQGTKLVYLNAHFGPYLETLDLRIPKLQELAQESFQDVESMENIQMSSYRFCCPQILGPNIPADKCHAPTDAISSCSDLMREPIMRVLLWLVGTTTLLGNLMVIVYRSVVDRNNTTSYRTFVYQLGMSDFLMGIYLLIIASMDTRFRGEYVLHDSSWRQSIGCKVAGFLSTFSSESSAMFIFFITLDRFLVIKFPFGEFRLTKVAIRVCSVFAWVAGFLIGLVPMLPPFEHWSVYSTNGMCLGLPLSVHRPPGWHYSVSVFVGFNFVLFLLIAAGQIAIYRSYSQKTTAIRNTSALAISRRKQEIAMAKRLSLIAVSDFLCWFPIGIMGILAIAGVEIGNDAYSWSAVIVLPINSALNPILYTWGAVKEKWANWQERKTPQSTQKPVCATIPN